MKEKTIVKNVVQTFYDDIASQYDKFYLDWDDAVREEAQFLEKLFKDKGYGESARILDCACGIGTQAIGLAALGYDVTASDISIGEIEEGKKRAAERNVDVRFMQADFRCLEETFSDPFDIVIAMDNALPHMLTEDDLKKAAGSISQATREGGMFAASIRDYDSMTDERPEHSAPYVHKTDNGQRVLFQTWDWTDANYRFVQYIIEDGDSLEVSKFECEYRAVTRDELTRMLLDAGFSDVCWMMPEETGFYQPIVTALK